MQRQCVKNFLQRRLLPAALLNSVHVVRINQNSNSNTTCTCLLQKHESSCKQVSVQGKHRIMRSRKQKSALYAPDRPKHKMQAVMPENTSPKSISRSKNGISVPVLHTATPHTVTSRALEGECAHATQTNGHTSNDTTAQYAATHGSIPHVTNLCMHGKQTAKLRSHAAAMTPQLSKQQSQ